MNNIENQTDNVIQITDQGNISLTPQEKIELEKRGFFLKNTITILDMIMTFPLFLGFHFMSLIVMIILMIPLQVVFFDYLFDMPAWIHIAFNQSLFLYLISQLFMTYVFQGKKFWSIDEAGVITSIEKERGGFFLDIFYDWINFFRNTESRIGFYMVSTISIGFFSGIFNILQENIAILDIHPYNDYLYPMFVVFFGFYIFGYLLRQLVEHISPIYIFDNLGEKIQKLTPTIEEQSKKIQSEFESTMNFSVLSHGFELLSRNFSEIVQLIIKLEKAEKRANQGNLFDSEKYINSLRSDIVTPLISLKTFLEEKKIELIQSKQELTRVRVGEDEETGNIDLQAKRSDPLVLVLTENIEKLDVMIGKMG